MSEPHATLSPGGYEKKDTSMRGIIAVTLVSLLIIVVSVIVVQETFISSREELVDEMVLKPESAALRELRAREIQTLTSYGVIDAEKGVYRIPIENAMKIMAEEAYQSSK